jgi:MYXO-CTERM domain-containing protein
MVCTPSTAGDLCLPGAKVGCVEVGGVCDSAVACTQGAICVGGICQVACDVIDGDGCGPGQGCARLEAGLRAGYCTNAGSTPLSGACAADGDCASLFCDKDITANNELRCLKPCDPVNPICGAGFACNALTPAVGACFFGDPPASGGEDASGQVGSLDGGSGGTTSYGTHATESDGCSSTRTSGRPVLGWLMGLVAVVWAVRRIRLQ